MTEPVEPIGGKYRLVRQLASGGMGTVHEALHLHTHGRVALKILSEEAKRDDASRARFAREAKACGRLRSRHVARVLDVDALDDGTPYLVMEFLDGEDLSRVIKARGPLSVPEAASILVQACAGVAEAHSHGIVHRDLKPGNIFLAREGASEIVKVLDFGISKVPNDEGEDELTRTFSTMGTPGYMSPEQIRAPKDVDAATDVWALGVMLYRLLTATLPFSGNSSSIAVAICHEAPKPITRDLPKGIRELIETAMDKDRARRPSVREFAEALAAHLDEDADIAHAAWSELSRLELPIRLALPAAAAEPTLAATHNDIPTVRRRSRWPLGAALAGVFLASGILFAATRDRSTPPAAAPAIASEPPPPPIALSSPTPPAPSSAPSVAPAIASAPPAASTSSIGAKGPLSPPKPKPSSNVPVAASIPARL